MDTVVLELCQAHVVSSVSVYVMSSHHVDLSPLSRAQSQRASETRCQNATSACRQTLVTSVYVCVLVSVSVLSPTIWLYYKKVSK